MGYLQGSRCWQHAAGCGLRVTRCGLRVSRYGFRDSSDRGTRSGLRVASCGLRTPGYSCEFRVCGLPGSGARSRVMCISGDYWIWWAHCAYQL